jgi:LPS-assembly lipoprotein
MSWSERRQFLRVAAGALAAPALAGCGFHMRGSANFAFKSIYVNAAETDPFARELRRAIDASGTATVATDPTKAEVTIDVIGPNDDKQVLSLSGGGRVREYQLVKRVGIALHDANGADWMPAADIAVTRSYTFNETEVLAREAQEAQLLKEMQSDLVSQIIRRLQAAHAPAG